MNKLTNVLCYYSGGGIYIYSALLNNDVWITTDFEFYGSYDMRWEEINEDLTEDGHIPYEEHWKEPAGQYPTWREVLDSIRKNCDSTTVHYAEEQITSRHKLNVRVNKDSYHL